VQPQIKRLLCIDALLPLFFAVALVVGASDCLAQSSFQTPTWNEMRALMGVTASSSQWKDFVARHDLIKVSSVARNAEDPSPPVYFGRLSTVPNSNSNYSIFVELDGGRVTSVKIFPDKGIKIAACLPMADLKPMTKESILAALSKLEPDGYFEASRKNTISYYFNAAAGFSISFSGEFVIAIEIFVPVTKK
jgi:hypothetical protein